VQDKAIELALTPRRAGTPTGLLNFDFTQPINGNLTTTSRGILYTPDKDFVGNDTFIIQIKNKTTSLGYSQIPIKMIVVGPDRVDKATTPETTSTYTAIASAIIATGALIFTATTFRRDDKTRQIQTAAEIMNDIQNLEKEGNELAQELDTAIIEYNQLLSEQQKTQTIEDQIQAIIDGITKGKGMDVKEKKQQLIQLRKKRDIWINTFCDKLEWMAFLILNRRLKDEDIAKFFDTSFTKMCDNIICKSESIKSKIKDVNSPYVNIKKLYRYINDREICDTVSTSSTSVQQR
jgi:predicted DNA-binding protein (MmcQ/YjbR family)